LNFNQNIKKKKSSEKKTSKESKLSATRKHFKSSMILKGIINKLKRRIKKRKVKIKKMNNNKNRCYVNKKRNLKQRK